MDTLAQTKPFQEIAEKGAALYEHMKGDYEPKFNGKFLAIEIESRKVYMGDTSGVALEQAQTENPGKLFYVVKVGSSSAETLAHSFVGQS